MFTILIGSVPKNQYNSSSDIDICRIGSETIVERKVSWPDGPINYIDYTFEEFVHLYEKGSLFMYHILNEGILIDGNLEKWNNLKDEFRFIDTYEVEIDDIKEILNKLFDIKIYGGTYLAFYSNLFTLLKNYAIFILAHNRIFEFNKRTAFIRVLGENYFDILCTAYNVFERNMDISNVDYDLSSSSLAQEIIDHYKKIMEEKNNDNGFNDRATN